MVGSGDIVASQGIHLCQGADHTRIAIVVSKSASGQAGARCRLYGDEAVIRLASQLLAHEGSDQAAQITAAAGTADDHVGLDAVFIHGRLGLQADDGLVEHHLVQHASQHVAVAGGVGGDLHRLGDGTAQAAACSGVLFQDPSAHLRLHRGRRSDGSAVGTHHFPAEGLLLVGHLHHVDLAIQAKISAGHGKGGAPLPCTRLGGDAGKALLFGVVGLGDGGIQLMGAAGVVALELIVDLGGGLQLFLQAVCTDQRSGTVHFIEAQDLLGNGEISGVLIHLLLCQLGAEHVGQLLCRHGLTRCGVQQRSGLVLHIRTEIVPSLRHLAFFQVDLVGNLFVCHGVLLTFFLADG